MQIIRRKIESTMQTTEEAGRVQASINSDGRITLRTYSCDEDSDE